MPINVDPVRIEQVLANLLINAAKYTPDGGRIILQTQPVNDSVVFTVRDNGIGISEEMLPRVFDLFVQADGGGKNSEDGLGIGLALVRKVVELHNGSVRAASAGLNRGSEFTITLPLATPAEIAPNQGESQVEVASHRA
jgi:signal transduction histidine kinase